MTVLYLGMDPSRWKKSGPLLHYPVIRTEPIQPLPKIPPLITHILFTSRSAVQYWDQIEDKILIAIGDATAQLLRERGGEPLVAATATQEGVIELLESLDLTDAYLLWPRSELARDLLEKYLEKKEVPFFAFDLYKTVFQCLQPIPSLDGIEEIVFTSPSTVEAFLQIYKELPKTKKLTAIGPITEESLKKSKSFVCNFPLRKTRISR